MPTKLYLSVAREDGIGSMSLFVQETFDEVIERIFPVQGRATSALEERANQLYTTLDGRRELIHPGNIFRVTEDEEPDE